jgi:UDPglucose--hexose-1-phosphate uridylyltransferase
VFDIRDSITCKNTEPAISTNPSYPEIRFNALTGDRVIVAANRAVRPNLPDYSDEAEELPHYDPSCPFCPGNEKLAATEVYRVPWSQDALDPDWQVRAVQNKYPALVEVPEPVADDAGRYRYAEPALGKHEVIIEHTRHDKPFIEFDDDELSRAMQAYRDRFAAAAQDPRIRHVVIFRNQGKLANATILHPHSQLAALSFVPSHVKRVLERALEHRGAGGHALLFDIVHEEVEKGDRLIDATKRFASFVPYAPSHDFEIWVAPRFVPQRLDKVDDETLLDFGLALRRALTALDSALNGPDYNYVLHTPPLLGTESALPWYVQIIPRRTLAAGFELGVGVQIVVTAPEAAAARLRDGLS